MTITVQNRITTEIVNTLKAIRIVAGYHFDATVEIESPTVNVPAGDFLLVSEGDPSVSDAKPINLDDYDCDYTIGYRRIRGEGDTRSAASLHAETFGDVKRALTRDVTRGGLAITTQGWGFSEHDSGGSGAVEGAITFSVWYRTVEDDPFASAFEA